MSDIDDDEMFGDFDGKKKPRKPKKEEAPQLSPEEIEENNRRYRQSTQIDIWSRDDTGHELTLEESLFVRSYIIDRNPVAAMRRLDYAGTPATLKRLAERFLSNPEVQASIEVLAKQMMSRLAVTAEQVNAAMAAVAFFDPRSVMQFDGLNLRVLDSRLWTDQQAAAIQGIKMTKDAGVEIKFNDRLRALEMLAKQLNLVQDPDQQQARALAEAEANRAVNKIADVLQRMSGNGATVIEHMGDSECEQNPSSSRPH